MLNLNLIGYLGCMPEVKESQFGRKYLRLRVGVNFGNNKLSTWIEVLWFAFPEGVLPFLTTGKQIFVSGRLAHFDTFLRRNGEPAAELQIIADCFELLSQSTRQVAQNEQDGVVGTTFNVATGEFSQNNPDAMNNLPY